MVSVSEPNDQQASSPDAPDAKPSVTLHIGTKKAGSTALQVYLQDNEHKLAELGWSYPSFLKNRNHMVLAFMFMADPDQARNHESGIGTPAEQEAARVAFAEELQPQLEPGQHWIFSSEMFAARLQTQAEVQALSDFLHQFFGSVDIVVYLRRQDFMVPSTYSQSVREGNASPLDWKYIEARRGWFDHIALLDRWTTVFGRSNVTVRPYLERYKRTTQDLLTDFFEAAGTPIEGIEPPARESRSHLNDRLSREGIEFMRLANYYYGRAGIAHVKRSNKVRRLSHRIGEYTDPSPLLPSTALTRQVRASFAADNDRLIELVGDAPIWQEWLEQAPEVDDDNSATITGQRFVHLLLRASDFEQVETAADVARVIETAACDIDWMKPDQVLDLAKLKTPTKLQRARRRLGRKLLMTK